MAAGDRVDIAFSPQINEYRGWRSVQLQIVDLRHALTRAQSERALYERFVRGEPITPGEAALSAAQPEEFVGLWRYLKERNGPAGVEETSRRLTRNLSRSFGRHAPLPRTMICLEVFDERGLIHLERSGEHLSIHIHPVGGRSIWRRAAFCAACINSWKTEPVERDRPLRGGRIDTGPRTRGRNGG